MLRGFQSLGAVTIPCNLRFTENSDSQSAVNSVKQTVFDTQNGGNLMLKRTCLALLATSLLATPALARDKTLYLGVEAGALWAKDINFDLVPDPLFDGDEVDDFFSVDHKMGYDLAAIFGYDGGLVRAELELGYKRAGHDEYAIRLPDLELDQWDPPVSDDGDG